MKTPLLYGLSAGFISFLFDLVFIWSFGISLYFIPPTVFALIFIMLMHTEKINECLIISLTTFIARDTFLSVFALSIAYIYTTPITITITSLFDVFEVVLGFIIMFIIAYAGSEINKKR